MTTVLEALRNVGQRVGLPTTPPPKAEPTPDTLVIFVAYNGVEKILPVRLQDTVQSVLHTAIADFHITTQPHLLSLHTEAGVELPDKMTVEEARVKPNAHVLLRPSAVKGGAG